MVDAVELWGASICQQSVSSLESHIARKHHAVGLSKHTELTEEARWQNHRRCRRRPAAPVEPRTPGSLPAQPHPTIGAASPHPLGGTLPRGRRRVGRRARRGGRAPRTGGRPRSIRWTPRVMTTTGGTPATTARRRRVGSSDPWQGTVRGRRVSLVPAPTMFVPSWVGSFARGVCERCPVLGVLVALHPSSHRELVSPTVLANLLSGEVLHKVPGVLPVSISEPSYLEHESLLVVIPLSHKVTEDSLNRFTSR